MKKLFVLVPAIALFLPGCIYVRDTRHVSRPRRDCHPSEYWDGYECRHKGKGHGGRKHDDD
jgi:hypothetical protein